MFIVNLFERPTEFLDDLATNATARGVGVVIYSGNYDSLVAHLGSQGMHSAYLDPCNHELK